MKKNEFTRIMLLVVWLLLATPLLWADNCGSADDCKAPPPNISKAVVVVSIFAGAGLAFRSMNGSAGADEQSIDPSGPDSPSTDANDGDPGPLPPLDNLGVKDKLGALGEDPPAGS